MPAAKMYDGFSIAIKQQPKMKSEQLHLN